MRKVMPWLPPLLAAIAPALAESAGSSVVLGPQNPLLADGARALEEGRFEDGIRLTLEGLKQPTPQRDLAAGHSNLCAGYAALKRWDEALEHCNRSLEIDSRNWRTFNNRAAVRVAKGLYDLAIADIHNGLELAPDSHTLRRSLEIVLAHKRAFEDRRRTAVRA